MENDEQFNNFSHLNFPQNIPTGVSFTNELQKPTANGYPLIQQTEFQYPPQQPLYIIAQPMNQVNNTKLPYSNCLIVLFFLSLFMVNGFEVLLSVGLLSNVGSIWLGIPLSIIFIFIFFLSVLSFLCQKFFFFIVAIILRVLILILSLLAFAATVYASTIGAPNDIARWMTVFFIGIPLSYYLISEIFLLLVMFRVVVVLFNIRKEKIEMKKEIDQNSGVELDYVENV